MSYIQNRITSVIPIGGIATLTGNSGGAISPTAGNINILGSGGISVAGSGSTLTITGSGSGFAWTEVTGTSSSMSINNGYIANNAGLVTLTLPSITVTPIPAVFGSIEDEEAGVSSPF